MSDSEPISLAPQRKSSGGTIFLGPQRRMSGNNSSPMRSPNRSRDSSPYISSLAPRSDIPELSLGRGGNPALNRRKVSMDRTSQKSSSSKPHHITSNTSTTATSTTPSSTATPPSSSSSTMNIKVTQPNASKSFDSTADLLEHKSDSSESSRSPRATPSPSPSPPLERGHEGGEGDEHSGGEVEGDDDELEEFHSADEVEGEGDEILKHPLQNDWTLWFDSPASRNMGPKSKNAWQSGVKAVANFSTLEDFWCMYNNLLEPSRLGHQANYHIFKSGVMPAWEDEANKQGGKWVIESLPKTAVNKAWLECLLAVIGEAFRDADEICGAVISLRKNKNRLALWTKTANNREAQNRIGYLFRSVVTEDMDNPPKASYQSHNAAISAVSASRKHSMAPMYTVG